MKFNDFNIQNEVTQAFQKYYSFKAISIEFIPVGEVSYAYIVSTDQGSQYFVKYTEQHDVIININRVNKLLTQLRQFPFVVPPVESNYQNSFDVMNGKISVYPYIEGEVIRMGNRKFDQDLVKELTKIMASIHVSETSVDLPKESFENNFAQRLENLLMLATKGELEEDLRLLLLDNEEVIRDLIIKHNVLSNKYLQIKPRFVLTHGDVTGLNVIRSTDGIKLVDWDNAMFAPAERDINFLFDNQYFSIDEYFALTHQSHFEPELKEYYGQDWSLNSIIGNFESILNQGRAKVDRNEYIEEINEYLDYYK